MVGKTKTAQKSTQVSAQDILTFSEVGALSTAVYFMLAGPADGVHERKIRLAQSAVNKLYEAGRSTWLAFSPAELSVLLVAISNGAEGVLQPSSGQSPGAKERFRRAANRIIDASGLNALRY